MDDIDTLRSLLTSVYLTQVQKAALGRVLGKSLRAAQPLRLTPLCDVPEDRVLIDAIPRMTPEPRLLNEAEKERERIELLGRCGAE